MLDDGNKKLGDLIKEAAEEYKNAPIGKGIVSNSKWYDLFVNIIPQEMSDIYNKSNYNSK